MGVGSAGKRVVLEVAGWLLVLLGIAALVLPGPGLLLLAAGLAVLSQQYEWAEKRVDPIFDKAKQGAVQSVSTWPRLVLSLLGVVWLIGLGIVWGLRPAAPGWWPLDDRWWLPGGWGTAASLILSGLFVAGLLVYARRLAREQR
jgi:hypothetical protein